MPKSNDQRAADITRAAKKALQTPGLPDDLRAMYKRIVDRGELREILVGAQALTLARMQAEAQAETQDTAQSPAPSEPTKETR